MPDTAIPYEKSHLMFSLLSTEYFHIYYVLVTVKFHPVWGKFVFKTVQLCTQ